MKSKRGPEIAFVTALPWGCLTRLLVIGMHLTDAASLCLKFPFTTLG